jgi:hypothetical protein
VGLAELRMSVSLPCVPTLSLRVGTQVAVVSLLLSGCGDPAPDPAQAPIEVVLDGCELNRSAVAPGTHEVSIVGSGRLEILDASGSVVATLSSPAPESVTLGEESYTFVCETSGQTERARLDSDPDSGFGG